MKDPADDYTRDAFGGETYEPKRDFVRLSGQLLRVKNLMADGRWRTLPEIRNLVGGSEAAVSARLRDLRKEKYGYHTVERESLGGGLFWYRLIINRQSAA
jgi:hypothetical protein